MPAMPTARSRPSGSKPTRNDARGLAQIARTGWYRAVHVKSDQCQALRKLVAGRKQLVIMRMDVENHIRVTLNAFGIKLGTVTSTGFSAKVKAVVADQDCLIKVAMLALLKVRDGVREQEKAFDKQCQQQAR